MREFFIPNMAVLHPLKPQRMQSIFKSLNLEVTKLFWEPRTPKGLYSKTSKNAKHL